MKVAMDLRLAGMIRALRWKAHGLAEETEMGVLTKEREREAAGRRQPRQKSSRPTTEHHDERTGG